MPENNYCCEMLSRLGMTGFKSMIQEVNVAGQDKSGVLTWFDYVKKIWEENDKKNNRSEKEVRLREKAKIGLARWC